MKDKITEWSYNHPLISFFLVLIFAGIIFFSLLFGIKNRLQQYQIEQVEAADFVMYAKDGKKFAMEPEIIVDMDTGYQYLVFNIRGDYIVAPRVSEDGTLYKTVK